MSGVLQVQGLTKRYPAFALEEVSFDLRPGAITGFIGRNGAGKSTTFKSLLNLVHPDAGEVRFFGLEFTGHEGEIKSRIGDVPGEFVYYPRKKLGAIVDVTRHFYPNWDEEAYRRCLERFSLEEGKTVSQLSAGMKVKFALTLALSHRAELLLLDEPTSGLDPVSREELLEEFLRLSREEGVTILFSTHITSDLDRCADEILYLRKGRLAERGSREELVDRYRLVTAKEKPENSLGACPTADGWTALYHTGDAPEGKPASLEDIMVHLEKGGEA